MLLCPVRWQGSTLITESPEGLYLYPPPERTIPKGGVYADVDLSDRAPQDRPLVLVNMVSTADGKAAIGGKAGGIGSEADRRAMRNLRAVADAIMIGAGTLRAERMSLAVPDHLAELRASRGKPPQPLAVVVSRSGDLSLESNLIGASPENTLVLIPETLPAELERRISESARVEKLPLEEDGLNFTGVMKLLRHACSVERLLVEGGPGLNAGLIGMDLVDELFLTISPRLAGGRFGSPTILEGPTLPGGLQKMHLISVAAVDDELFLRYRLR